MSKLKLLRTRVVKQIGTNYLSLELASLEPIVYFNLELVS